MLRDKTPKKYTVISLDVWGNEDDGWEVNAAYRTSDTAEVDWLATNEEIHDQLKKQGYCETVSKGELEIESNHDGSSLYLYDLEQYYKPLAELRRVEE